MRCSRGVELVGALPDGRFMSYSALVPDAAPEIDAIAPLLSLEAQSGMNAWFDGKPGKLCCLPAGIDAGGSQWNSAVAMQQGPLGTLVAWIRALGRSQHAGVRACPPSNATPINVRRGQQEL